MGLGGVIAICIADERGVRVTLEWHIGMLERRMRELGTVRLNNQLSLLYAFPIA
jgi:hypothetical protein